MRCELLVALLFVLSSHFVYRVADGRTCHLEHPCAFRATPAPKIRPFDPYQFAAHRLQGTPPLVRLGFVKDGGALVFTATTKPLFQCLERGSGQAATLRQIKRTELSTIGKCGVCGVSNKRQELLSQSKVVLELLNYAVAFTGGFFECPAIFDIHCTTHVLDDSLFLQC
jgi:hypothetical protein